MERSQLAKDLQNRLSFLLKDPAFAHARKIRAAQSKWVLENAISAYNLAISEEILHLDELSANGVVEDKILSDFRRYLTCYMKKHGTGHKGYDAYVTIICEYLAMVAQKPMHPLEVRKLEKDLPKDTDSRWYCALKPLHIKDPFSLCRFCVCTAWTEKSR